MAENKKQSYYIRNKEKVLNKIHEQRKLNHFITFHCPQCDNEFFVESKSGSVQNVVSNFNQQLTPINFQKLKNKTTQ